MTSGQHFYQYMNDQDDVSNSFLDQFNGQEERKIHSSQFEGQKNCESISLPVKKAKSKNQKAGTNRAKKQKVAEENPSNPNMKFGHWSLEENKKYHWFLEIYNSHFMNKHMRRMDKIFKTMANFIGSREAEQCRSHHQKMEKKYHSFSKILINLRKQHYNTQEPIQIEADMIANNVQMIVELLSASALEEQMYTVPNSPNIPSQHTIKSDVQTQQMNELLFVQENDPIASLLCDENYQNNLNFIAFF